MRISKPRFERPVRRPKARPQVMLRPNAFLLERKRKRALIFDDPSLVDKRKRAEGLAPKRASLTQAPADDEVSLLTARFALTLDIKRQWRSHKLARASHGQFGTIYLLVTDGIVAWASRGLPDPGQPLVYVQLANCKLDELPCGQPRVVKAKAPSKLASRLAQLAEEE